MYLFFSRLTFKQLILTFYDFLELCFRPTSKIYSASWGCKCPRTRDACAGGASRVVPVGERAGEWKRNETPCDPCVLRIQIIHKVKASQGRTPPTSLVHSKHLCARVRGVFYRSMFEHWIMQLFRQAAEPGLKSNKGPFRKIPNRLDYSQAPSFHLKWEPFPEIWHFPNLVPD